MTWNVLFSWASFRNPWLEKVLQGAPTRLVDHGRAIEKALRRERINLEELRARLRLHGIDDLSQIREAFLETDGKVRFVRSAPWAQQSSAPRRT